jgi:HK97 family phage prohead protease
MKKREIRSTTSDLQTTGNILTGYIARFNSLSEDLGGFREMLSPGCFSSSLTAGTAIRALANHNTDHCLGNTASGTLRLHEDNKGLAFECDLPDTTAARDLKISVSRGDVTGCSFGFCTVADSWTADAEGRNVRTVKDTELYEVSVGVTFPAYSSPSAQLRSMFPDGEITIPETRDDSDTPDVALDDNAEGDCQCDCEQCQADACAICSNEDCNDPNCDCQNIRAIMLALEVAKEF